MNKPKIELLDIENEIDVEQVIKIFNGSRPDFVIQHSIEEDRNFFKKNIIPNSKIFILKKNIILGFISMKANHIDHLYIKSSEFGKGYGTLLLNYVKELYNVLSLWVFQKNQKAVKFYLSNDFIISKETNGRGNDENLPDYYMEWRK